jgi:hypothetical protein
MDGIKESENKTTYELDWSFIRLMAERMNGNKDKYPRNNWMKPMNKNEMMDALARHFVKIQEGNYNDEQTYGHLIALACNAMIICYQLKNETFVNN